jgi:hypothetical protein
MSICSGDLKQWWPHGNSLELGPGSTWSGVAKTIHLNAVPGNTVGTQFMATSNHSGLQPVLFLHASV